MSKSSLSFILDNKPDAVKEAPNPSSSDSASRRNSVNSAASSKFQLSILQQPVHSKVTPRSHYNSRILAPLSEHRPIHPPPVLKLVISGEDLESSKDAAESSTASPHTGSDKLMDEDNLETKKVLNMLGNKRPLPREAHFSTFFVTADIVDTNEGSNDSEIFSDDSSKRNSSVMLFDSETLSGSKVSSGMHIKLPLTNTSNPSKGKRGGNAKGDVAKSSKKNHDFSICFVFGDISVRKLGKFKLLFSLYEFKNYKINYKYQVLSDVFTVYSQKKFPGAIPSTPLTRFLYKHGARIRQRKSKAELTAGSSNNSSATTAAGASSEQNNNTSPPMSKSSSYASNTIERKRSFSLTTEGNLNGGPIKFNKRIFPGSQYNYVNGISPIQMQSASPLPSPIHPLSATRSTYSPPVSPVFPYYASGSNPSSTYTSPGSGVQLVSPLSSNFPPSGGPSAYSGYNYFQKPFSTSAATNGILPPPSAMGPLPALTSAPQPTHTLPSLSQLRQYSVAGTKNENVVTVGYRQPIGLLNPPPKIRRSKEGSSNSNTNRFPNSTSQFGADPSSVGASLNNNSNSNNNNNNSNNNNQSHHLHVFTNPFTKGPPPINNGEQKIKLPSLTGLNLLY